MFCFVCVVQFDTSFSAIENERNVLATKLNQSYQQLEEINNLLIKREFENLQIQEQYRLLGRRLNEIEKMKDEKVKSHFFFG